MSASARCVLMVGTFLSQRGGSRCVCEDLADRLAANGWRVLRTSRFSGRLPRVADMVRTAWSQRKVYGIAQVDVYSGLAFGWAEAVCWVLRRAGRPYLLTLHGGNLPAFARRYPGRVRRLLGSAAAVTAPSRYLVEELQDYCGTAVSVPNGLDIEQYPFRERDHCSPRLIWLRSFHRLYRPDLAIAVLTRVQASYPEAGLTMIGADKGDGSLQEVEATVQRLGLTDSVRVIAGVPKHEVPARLSEADLFLNTSSVDNTPVSVLEAMACGLVVVSTEVGGIRHLLKHESDALLVPPGNPELMAQAVVRAMREPGLSGRLSRHARESSKRYDWASVIPMWVRLLQSASQSSH